MNSTYSSINTEDINKVKITDVFSSTKPDELLCFMCGGWGDMVKYNKSIKICIVCNGRGVPPIPMCELR